MISGPSEDRFNRAQRLFLPAYRSFGLLYVFLNIYLYGDFSTSVLLVLIPVCLYSVYKIIYPGIIHRHDTFKKFDFAVDIIISGSAVFLTGGIKSPYLIYSITPILTGISVYPLAFTISGTVTIILFLIASELTVFKDNLYIDTQLWINSLTMYGIFLLVIIFMSLQMKIGRSHDIRHAVAGERARIAKEIHDDIGQYLAYIKMETDRLQSSIEKADTKTADNTLVTIKTALDEVLDKARKLGRPV